VRSSVRNRQIDRQSLEHRMTEGGAVDPDGLVKLSLVSRYGRHAAQSIILWAAQQGISVRDAEMYHIDMENQSDDDDMRLRMAMELEKECPVCGIYTGSCQCSHHQDDIARLLDACPACGVPRIACMCDESDPESEAGKALLEWADSKYEEIVDRIREDV